MVSSTPTPTPTPSTSPVSVTPTPTVTISVTPTLTPTPSPSFIPPTPFIGIWRTTGSSETITLPFKISGTYSGTIDWGDGNTSVNSYGNRIHIYDTPGDYTVTIYGVVNGFGYVFDDIGSGETLKLIEIQQWGAQFNLGSDYNYGRFMGCSNLTLTGVTDTLNLNGTIDIMAMFSDCSNITTIQNINNWDVSNINNLLFMFKDTQFDQDISGWDVSNVTNMRGMFYNSSFNQDISGWNVSGVTDMFSMFQGTQFNQDISGWDVSNVTNMSGMFNNTPFNQDISGWDVSSVTNMGFMFLSTPFNQDISGWDVSKVTNMGQMFQNSSFNQDIGKWNVSGVTDMGSMFWSALSFNQDISGWDVSNVTSIFGMYGMFFSATSFNQDLSSWCVPLIPSLPPFFDDNTPSWVLPRPNWGTCPPFISIWRTTSPNETITLPYENTGTYDGTIDWGDGNTSGNSYSNRTHTYLTPGDYTITISGDCVGFRFNDSGDDTKITTVITLPLSVGAFVRFTVKLLDGAVPT